MQFVSLVFFFLDSFICCYCLVASCLFVRFFFYYTFFIQIHFHSINAFNWCVRCECNECSFAWKITNRKKTRSNVLARTHQTETNRKCCRDLHGNPLSRLIICNLYVCKLNALNDINWMWYDLMLMWVCVFRFRIEILLDYFCFCCCCCCYCVYILQSCWIFNFTGFFSRFSCSVENSFDSSAISWIYGHFRFYVGD